MIVGIVGTIGCGKTMLQTCFLVLGADAGSHVLANYKLKGIPYTPLDDMPDFLSIKGDKNLIGLDEYWLSADARRAASIVNMASTTWSLQSRKIHSDVFVTTQSHMQLDIRIRNIISMWMEPEIAMRDENGKPTMLRVKTRILKGASTIDRSFIMPCQIPTRNFGLVDIPNAYDSYQIIESVDLDRRKGYEKYIKKYSGYDGGEKGLAAILEFDENIPRPTAKDLASYIKAKQC